MSDTFEPEETRTYRVGFIHLSAVVLAGLTAYKMGTDGWNRSGWGGLLLYGATGLVLGIVGMILVWTVFITLLAGTAALLVYLYASPATLAEELREAGDLPRGVPLRGRIVSGLVIAAVLVFWGLTGPDLIRSVGSREQYQDALLMGIYLPACFIALASLPWTAPLLKRRLKSVPVAGISAGAESGGIEGGSPTLQDDAPIS